jgi:hypothetical protein
MSSHPTKAIKQKKEITKLLRKRGKIDSSLPDTNDTSTDKSVADSDEDISYQSGGTQHHVSFDESPRKDELVDYSPLEPDDEAADQAAQSRSDSGDEDSVHSKNENEGFNPSLTPIHYLYRPQGFHLTKCRISHFA